MNEDDAVPSGSDPQPPAEMLRRAERVLRRVAPRLMGPLLRQRGRTSDLVQSALADAVAAFPSFRGRDESEFIGWTLRILQHNALDRRRRQLAARRHVARELATDEAGDVVAARARSPSQTAMDREELVRMARAMRTLAPEQRRVLQLVGLRGLSHAEASRTLDRSEGACRVLLARARASLLVAMARLRDAAH